MEIDMSMAYIRKYYNVPAKRGTHIKFTDFNGVTWLGLIKSARDSRLRVKFYGLRETATLHPTWNIVYMPPNDPVQRAAQEEPEK
jgi:hypothetical protein